MKSALILLLRALIHVAAVLPKHAVWVSADTPSRNDEVNELGQKIYDYDTTWAVKSNHLSDQFGDKQGLYDEYLAGCQAAAGKQAHAACVSGEETRLRMDNFQPMAMRNYTKMGFKKIRAPKEMFDLLKDFWDKNRDEAEIEWKTINPYHNMWDAPPYILDIQNPKHGGGDKLKHEVWSAARKVLEEWTGMHLAPCSIW
jgi:hypothetical protein